MSRGQKYTPEQIVHLLQQVEVGVGNVSSRMTPIGTTAMRTGTTAMATAGRHTLPDVFHTRCGSRSEGEVKQVIDNDSSVQHCVSFVEKYLRASCRVSYTNSCIGPGSTMRIKVVFCVLLACLSPIHLPGQLISAPEPQSGSITGNVEDVAGGVVPGATVSIHGPAPSDRRTVTTNENGVFTLNDLRPAASLYVTVNAKGFAAWTSPAIILKPGQFLDMAEIHLALAVVETTVTAIMPEQLALQQVKAEEKQRILGVIPNIYVVYDNNPMPLTTKLKYELALKAATNPVTVAGSALLAGIYQAADTPNYVQGLKGYGQRFGAAYADGFTDIMIGGAILPSLLHQDPRYFYQGTGTKRSRAVHAISAPFVAKGDNGRWEFNYSSIGGDLASGALSNLYYPPSNRGATLVFSSALITTGGRIANSLSQEFILHKITNKAKGQNSQ
jgi:Carboxypeptidase regulatory-like domain